MGLFKQLFNKEKKAKLDEGLAPSKKSFFDKLSKAVGGKSKVDGQNARFRKDRPSYAEMAKFAAQQSDMFDQNEEAIPCFCGD